MLAKADPLNAASLLLAAFLVGYRSTRGVSLLERVFFALTLAMRSLAA